jgi:translation initiation factor IF-3
LFKLFFGFLATSIKTSLFLQQNFMHRPKLGRYFYYLTTFRLAENSSPKPGGGGQRPGGGNNNNRPNNNPGGPRPGGGPGGPRPGGPGGQRPSGPRPSGPGGPPRPGGGPGGPPRPGAPGGPQRPVYDRRYGKHGPPVAEHRINELIRGVQEMRLVGDNLEEISGISGKTIEAGVYSYTQLREWAESCDMDLVEITPNAVPPIARIVDYNKFLYQKRKKEKELKANNVKQQLKEIRFGPETGEHDFEFKLRHAKGFLEEGNKVKAYVQFRGRAIVFKDRGELLLLRFLKELEEHGVAEQMPKLEGKKMMVILSPKKGGGKKG